MDSLSGREPERARERDGSQAASQPACLPARQHRRGRQIPDPATPHPHPLTTTTTSTAIHRHASRTYAPTHTHVPPSTPTRYPLHPPTATSTPTHNTSPHALAAPQSSSTSAAAARSLARPSACLAATAITPPTPCIACRRRASQSPVTCETPALASSLRLSHNLALENGVKSMHAPPSAARRSHWHSAACDRATLAPNKPSRLLTVIHRSSSGNTSSW